MRGSRTKNLYIQSRLRFYAAAIATCGVGSFIYHASNNRLTQFLDFMGMYVVAWPIMVRHGCIVFFERTTNLAHVLFFLLCQTSNLVRLGVLKETFERVVAVVGIVTFGVLVPIFNALSIPIQLLVLSLIFGITTTEVTLRRQQKDRPLLRSNTSYFMRSIAYLITAAFFSFLDVSRTWCDPSNHVLQGHAVWHCFSALALFNAGCYQAYQAERTRP